MSQHHPFIYAYEPQDFRYSQTIDTIWKWTSNKFGAPANIPQPTVLIVGHDHMQTAASRITHYTKLNGGVHGWYSQQYPRNVFLSDSVSLVLPKVLIRSASILVHEFVHYLQDNTTKYDNIKPFNNSHVLMLEQEADTLMHQYVISHTIN